MKIGADARSEDRIRPEQERPTRLTLAALAAPSLPIVALTLPLNVYVPEHYGNALGINLGTVGLIFMLVRLADIGFDPFIGGVMDRTRTRWGPYKPWLAISAPVIMIGVAMLFLARPGVGPLYLTLWLGVVYAAFSMATLSQLSLAAGLSGDYNERSRVYGWWQAGNTLGAMVVLLFPMLWPWLTGDGIGDGEIVPLMGWFIILATPPAFALALFGLHPARRSDARDAAGPREYFRLLRHRSVRIILSVDLALGIGAGVSSASMIFFVTLTKGLDRKSVGIILICYMFVATISAPFWSWLAGHMQKHRALMVSSLLHAVAMAMALAAPHGSLVAMVVVMSIGGVSYGGNTILPRAMIADAGDEERLESGIARTGMLYAWITSVFKIGSALAVGGVFLVLDAVGFVAAAGADNPPGALATINILYAGVATIMSLLAIILLTTYPLTAARHAAIKAELLLRERRSTVPDPT